MRLGCIEKSRRFTTATSKQILNVSFTTVSEYQNYNEHTNKSNICCSPNSELNEITNL